jgi:hypothetical protein
MKAKRLKILGITLGSLVFIYFFMSIIFPNYIGIPLAGLDSYKEFKKMKNEKKIPIETLEYAISDVGLWTWWATDSLKYIQLEFDRTMLLLSEPTEEQPPSNRLAIQFKSPLSAIILTKKDSKLPTNWLTLFHEDKLEPFQIDYEYFSFDPTRIDEIMQLCDSSKVIFGASYEDITDLNNKVKLGFWAGEIGLVVVADTMKMVSHSGEIKLNEIQDLHSKWWKYWGKYWEVIDSDKKLPYDPLCEITIPATKQNMKKIKENIDKEKE